MTQDLVLDAMHAQDYGQEAAVIGEVTEKATPGFYYEHRLVPTGWLASYPVKCFRVSVNLLARLSCLITSAFFPPFTTV